MALYSQEPRRLYSDADTSRLDVLDYLGNPVCFIDFTTEFKYLGSIVHHSLTSDADVHKRIGHASATFWVLESIMTNKDVDIKVKGRGTLFEHSTLRQRNLMLTGISVQSPSSFPLSVRSNHVPYYHRSNNLPPYFICEPL
jgi:hypothetical protein